LAAVTAKALIELLLPESTDTGMITAHFPKEDPMAQGKAARLLFAYFERPTREYARTIESVRATGGLSLQDIDEIRENAAPVHVETILRHLGSDQQAGLASARPADPTS
jgi:hypothetical protein